jgi:protein-tyrosine phosphatase
VHAIPGRKADPRARKVATQFGISLDNHHAQLLSQEMVAQADIIFVMDYVNEAELLARYPEATRKIFLLGSYAKVVHGGIEIWDPYFGNEAEVRRCYTTLDSCIQNLAASLGLIDARQNAK